MYTAASAAAISNGSIAERILIRLRAFPAKVVWMLAREADLGSGFFDRLDGVAQRHTRRQIEGDGNGRKQALVVYRQRRGRRRVLCHGAQRNRWPLGDVHINLAQDTAGSARTPARPP